MQIHDLKSFKKRVQRIGRSGKRGSYSGRGVKGQKSRSGRRLRPAERDLIMRLPKMRGFANKRKSDRPIALTLEVLAAALAKHVQGKSIDVNKDTLKTAGVLRKGYTGFVKVLNTGDVTFAMVIKDTDIKVSEGAKVKIEKAGGKIN